MYAYTPQLALVSVKLLRIKCEIVNAFIRNLFRRHGREQHYNIPTEGTVNSYESKYILHRDIMSTRIVIT